MESFEGLGPKGGLRPSFQLFLTFSLILATLSKINKFASEDPYPPFLKKFRTFYRYGFDKIFETRQTQRS